MLGACHYATKHAASTTQDQPAQFGRAIRTRRTSLLRVVSSLLHPSSLHHHISLHLIHSSSLTRVSAHSTNFSTKTTFPHPTSNMPPKAAEKKPSTGGKAPAGKAPAAEKKEGGKKTAPAAAGEKKKRGKTRKETYSSYIYKGTVFLTPSPVVIGRVLRFRRAFGIIISSPPQQQFF